MILLDVTNNRPILDGSTVFLGDQVLIDIKAPTNDNKVSIIVENCSVSALTSAEDILSERVDLFRKGCPVRNDYSTVNLNFRAISDTHVESNAFDIFRLKSSTLILFNCWVQICAKRGKCLNRHCSSSLDNVSSRLSNSNNNNNNNGKQRSNTKQQLNGRNSFNPFNNNNLEEDEHGEETDGGEESEDNGENENNIEYYQFKDSGVRVNIEDPYGIQQNAAAAGNGIGRSFRNGESLLPSLIGETILKIHYFFD